MKRITVFAFLIILLVSAASSVSLTKADSEVTILSHDAYVGSTGSYYIVGEVQNIGSNPLKYVKIIATYYNSSGDVVATDYTYTELNVIHPNQKSPFKIILIETQQVAKIDHYLLSVSSYSNADELSAKLQILSNSSYIGLTGYMYIVGEIKNIGNETANYTHVIATFYDLNGKVIATDYTYTEPEHIAPNQTAPFEIILIETNRIPLIHSYELTAESNQYSTIPEKILLITMIIILAATSSALILIKRKSLLGRANNNQFTRRT
jgi:hypothetical protein